jgi:DNA-directed RNA polymerase alpha subunit
MVSSPEREPSPLIGGEEKDATKMKVEDLNLSARVTSALTDAGIRSAAGLARKSASSLKELDGVGDKAIDEIQSALRGLGLSLKPE